MDTYKNILNLSDAEFLSFLYSERERVESMGRYWRYDYRSMCRIWDYLCSYGRNRQAENNLLDELGPGYYILLLVFRCVLFFVHGTQTSQGL